MLDKENENLDNLMNCKRLNAHLQIQTETKMKLIKYLTLETVAKVTGDFSNGWNEKSLHG